MTRKDEILAQIAEAKKRMEATQNVVSISKRVKTADERKTFDLDVELVKALELELKDAEATERIQVNAPNILTSEKKTKNRIYNPSRGILNFMNNNFSGLEGEIHQEARKSNPDSTGFLVPDELIYKRTSKRGETFANSHGLYSEIAQGLDIVSQPSLYEALGCTVYNNLTNVIKLNYARGLEADTVAELAAFTEKSYNKIEDSLTPIAHGHMISTTTEAMSVIDIMSDYFLDADQAIGARITKDLLLAILADSGCILSGYTSGTTSVLLTSKMVNLLKSSVLTTNFKHPAYAIGGLLYGELEETQAATVLRTIITDGKINSWDAVNVMTLLLGNFLIFGDFGRAYIGKFGNATEILVNPYTNQATRKIVISFNRLMDYSFNPYVFKTIQNARIA